MNDLWMCCNCDSIVTLDKHGRCSVCGSDAVVRRALEHLALVARLWPEQDPMIAELEALFGKS
jgi:hypothetical protein